MKHASEQKLLSISPLLEELRETPGIKEKNIGVFYRNSKAFLHFHEDGDKIFADIRLEGPDFKRLPSTTQAEKENLLGLIRKAVQ